MKTIFFSSNLDAVDEWTKRHEVKLKASCYDVESLKDELKKREPYVLIVDYDSVASELNKLISSNEVPQNSIVLERTPEIATGKMLISHSIKAYGNSRMANVHYSQMIQTVIDSKVWTYPELTAVLAQNAKREKIGKDSRELIDHRLSQKEKEVAYLVLDGLTNNAIASKLEITTRTVKAHVSSIFSKLRVNDRVSLILLLR